jgi:uncharacterized protein YkwD
MACGDSPVAPLDPELDADVGQFVQMMNTHRMSVGCSPLAWNESVAAVAQSHSQDMVARGFFDHTNPSGKSARDRLEDAGIPWSSYGENIAAGYNSGAAVLNGWLDSPGHRSNIENCTHTEHGVGLVSGHWTHVFIRP